MLTLISACDNVHWGGSDLAVVPPPPKASGLPASAEDLAEELPAGPILFYVVPRDGRGIMVPVGEIAGDSMLPLRARKDPALYAGRFIAAHMRRGAEFALYRNGARVGTFVVQSASPPDPNTCPALPHAQGTLELSSGAQDIPEFLAIAKPHAPEIRRQLEFPTEPTRNMQVIAPILAERMIRARDAELPGNWQRAMAQLKPIPIANARDPGFATTFVVGDELRTGGDNQGYSVFFIGVPGAQFGYDTTFVKFTKFETDGKAAPRVVDILDWNRDGQVDLLLQVYGISDTWFEAVGKNQRNEWQTTFRDRCERPGASPIPAPGAIDSAAVTDTTPS
ncbi:MAG: hypothetical protein ACT443_07555 [Gemmatimonadota bacterium]